MSPKGRLRIVSRGHAAYCFGCEEYHVIYDTWQFNGNYDLPTFSPSLLVRWFSERFQKDYTCHSFIRNGRWEFLKDCTHGKAGQTIPLRDEESHLEN